MHYFQIYESNCVISCSCSNHKNEERTPSSNHFFLEKEFILLFVFVFTNIFVFVVDFYLVSYFTKWFKRFGETEVLCSWKEVQKEAQRRRDEGLFCKIFIVYIFS